MLTSGLRLIIVLGLAAALTGLHASQAAAQTRRALVIGADDYRNVSKLQKAVGDARAMKAVLEKTGNIPIYCTAASRDRIGERYPGADFRPVADGSSLTLGDYTFRFIHTPGLHWPDNMVTWLESDKILFSNDLFGQYLAEDPPVEGGLSDEEILAGSRPYFEKVFRSSTPEKRSVILDITDLPIHTLAPGHGLVLQDRWPALRDYYREEAVKE